MAEGSQKATVSEDVWSREGTGGRGLPVCYFEGGGSGRYSIGENIGRGFSIGISDEGSEGTGHRGLIYSFEGSSGRINKMSEEQTGG